MYKDEDTTVTRLRVGLLLSSRDHCSLNPSNPLTHIHTKHTKDLLSCSPWCFKYVRMFMTDGRKINIQDIVFANVCFLRRKDKNEE